MPRPIAICKHYADAKEARCRHCGQNKLEFYPTPTAEPTSTDGRHDSYIKLYDYGARWYDPQIGRFISPDTIIPDPGNSQSFNRYAYVENNPIRYTDSTGHCIDPVSGTICAVGLIAIEATLLLGAVAGSYAIDQQFDNPSSAELAGELITDLGEVFNGPVVETFPAPEVRDPHDYYPGGVHLGPQENTPLVFPLPDEQPQTIGLDIPVEQPYIPNILTSDDTIYRGGKTNPGNLTTTRPQDEGELSFRDSLSNPWPLPEGQRPPLEAGKPYFGVDPAQLPDGSVIYDNDPPGHVGVKNVAPEVLKDAIVEKGKFP